MSAETRVSTEQIEAMLAGLQGVTPGPWDVFGASPNLNHVEGAIGGKGEGMPICSITKNRPDDAAHIARCDPDTIRAAFTELRDLRASRGGEPVAAEVLRTMLVECRKQVAAIIDDGAPTDFPAWLADIDAALVPSPPPSDGVAWRCFHCDEVFTSEDSARAHFGSDESSEPACKIKAGAEQSLVKALRDAEDEAANAWAAVHNESTDAAKAYHRQNGRHHTQLRAAEEAGYERGLHDGRKETAPSPGPGTTFADGVEAAAKLVEAFPLDGNFTLVVAQAMSDRDDRIANHIRALAPPVPQVSGEGWQSRETPKLTKAGQTVQSYLTAWKAMYPNLKPPVVTRRGSWFHVQWHGEGSKSARTEEIVRMTLVLREMKLRLADRAALAREGGK